MVKATDSSGEVLGLNLAMTWLNITFLFSLSYKRENNVCKRNASGVYAK